jgi:hypothetical protein
MAQFKQLNLFSVEEEPTEKEVKEEQQQRQRPIPEYAWAVFNKHACICIKTGDYIEDFKLHTLAMSEHEFMARVSEYTEQLLGLFKANERFFRMLAAQRGWEPRPIRHPLYHTSGPLHQRAHTIARQAFSHVP